MSLTFDNPVSMVINVLIVIILVSDIVAGYKKGFLESTIRFVRSVIAMLIAYLVKTPLSTYLYLNFPFFNLDGIFSQDVAFYLNKYNVCVRAGNHCAKLVKSVTGVRNTIRVSLYFYNTESDIDSLIELLTNKEKIMKEMI